MVEALPLEGHYEQVRPAEMEKLLCLVDGGVGTSETEQSKAWSFLHDLSNDDLADLDDALVAEKGPEVNLALIMISNELLRRKNEGLIGSAPDSAEPAPKTQHDDSDSKIDAQGSVSPGELDEFDKPHDELA